MRIQHNITALSAANRLKANENTVAKNIQKLSSGYRINSAADDAAGLAVSEKMRKEINGLSQAEDNTKNGISLIQTAEGGLNETSAILQRMNTLAVEASNGTYKDSDRDNLQMEVNSLNTEIDRISTSTKFNEISLLDGSLSGTQSASYVATFSGIPTGALSTVTSAKAESESFTAGTSLAKKGDSVSYTVDYTDDKGKTQSVTASYTATADSDSGVVAGIEKQLQGSGLGGLFNISDNGSGTVSFNAKTAGAGEGVVTGISTSSFTQETNPVVAVGTTAASGVTEVDNITNVIGGGTTAGDQDGTLKAGDVVSYTVNYTDAAGKAQTATVSYTAQAGDNKFAAATGIKTALANDSTFSSVFTVAVDGTNKNQINVTAKHADVGNGKVNSATATLTTAPAASLVTQAQQGIDAFQSLDMSKFTPGNPDQSSFTVNGQKFAFVNSSDEGKALPSSEAYVVVGTSGTIGAADTTNMAALIQQKTGLKTAVDVNGKIDVYGKETSSSTNGVTFQVGAENTDDQRASLSVGNMNAANLGLTAINIGSQLGAQSAIDIISAASAKVSTARAQLGALQNELEHTSNNLSTMNENLTSAESTIRDVDMTDEYVQYSKNQILSQAANSMLAQANAQPQNVLSLLKG